MLKKAAMCFRSAILISYGILYILPCQFYVLMLKEASIFDIKCFRYTFIAVLQSYAV
jgi:hypothetical protein